MLKRNRNAQAAEAAPVHPAGLRPSDRPRKQRAAIAGGMLGEAERQTELLWEQNDRLDRIVALLERIAVAAEGQAA